MAVKGEAEETLFVPPPTDPYLIGIARCVDDSLAHVQPGGALP